MLYVERVVISATDEHSNISHMIQLPLHGIGSGVSKPYFHLALSPVTSKQQLRHQTSITPRFLTLFSIPPFQIAQSEQYRPN
jgi:hypothetical protein